MNKLLYCQVMRVLRKSGVKESKLKKVRRELKCSDKSYRIVKPLRNKLEKDLTIFGHAVIGVSNTNKLYRVNPSRVVFKGRKGGKRIK